MGTIFTALGWMLAILFAAVTVSAAARLVRYRGWRVSEAWISIGFWACLALCAYTGLGALRLLTGITLAAVTGLATGIGIARHPQPIRLLRMITAGDIGYLGRTIRLAAGKARGGPEPVMTAPAPAQPAAPAAPAPAPATAGQPRTVPAPVQVPSVRDDPALGDTPPPAEVAGSLASAGTPLPLAWAALCEEIAGHEPGTNEEELQFLAGQAAGSLAYADAWRTRTDTLLHGIGLDPGYVAGNLEYADEVSENSSALAMVVRRFHAIYQALLDWVEEHPEGMPHRAREFLQGGAATPQPAAGTDDLAA